MNEYLFFIPYVNRVDLLLEAVESLKHFHHCLIIIDQSEEGLIDCWDGRISIHKWIGDRRFTCVQNWMQQRARECSFFFFMHSDASCSPDDVNTLLSFVKLQQGKWGVVFTNYDTLCCFNNQAVKDVGEWDETFSWYVADVDYYNRLKWSGWEQRVCPIEVKHHGSQTLLALGEEERQKVERDSSWALSHYEHKWGRSIHYHMIHDDRYAIPYNSEVC